MTTWTTWNPLFYIFTLIIYTYDRYGVSYPLDEDSDLAFWDEHEGWTAALVKRGFLAVSSTPYDVTLRWPEVCIRVLHRFQDFIRDIVRKKMAIIHENPATPADLQKPLQLTATCQTHQFPLSRLKSSYSLFDHSSLESQSQGLILILRRLFLYL
jgi:hypothetical protein